MSRSHVQGAVCGTDVAGADEHNVDQRPHAQTAEAEQLADAALPQTQVEAVDAEAAQSDAQHKCRRPLVPVRPVATEAH